MAERHIFCSHRQELQLVCELKQYTHRNATAFSSMQFERCANRERTARSINSRLVLVCMRRAREASCHTFVWHIQLSKNQSCKGTGAGNSHPGAPQMYSQGAA